MERRLCTIKESGICETTCVLNYDSQVDGNVDYDKGLQA